MTKYICFLLFLVSSNISCLEKLDEAYLVSYGDANSEVKITSYFSFTCPHCVSLFRREFSQVKNLYINSNRVHLTFHPVPMDLLTVKAMACLENLTNFEKKIFLEAVLEEIDIEDANFNALLMQKAMEVLGKPIPLLQDRDYLSKTSAFNAAFAFLKQEEKIGSVPTIEVNGRVYPEEVPDHEFIGHLVEKLMSKDNSNEL